MRLTKLQRHTAYILMLAESKKVLVRINGFCAMFHYELGFSILHAYSKSFPKRMFPELYKKSIGLTEGEFYFNNWEEREAALQQCIIETY